MFKEFNVSTKSDEFEFFKLRGILEKMYKIGFNETNEPERQVKFEIDLPAESFYIYFEIPAESLLLESMANYLLDHFESASFHSFAYENALMGYKSSNFIENFVRLLDIKRRTKLFAQRTDLCIAWDRHAKKMPVPQMLNILKRWINEDEWFLSAISAAEGDIYFTREDLEKNEDGKSTLKVRAELLLNDSLANTIMRVLSAGYAMPSEHFNAIEAEGLVQEQYALMESQVFSMANSLMANSLEV